MRRDKGKEDSMMVKGTERKERKRKQRKKRFKMERKRESCPSIICLSHWCAFFQNLKPDIKTIFQLLLA